MPVAGFDRAGNRLGYGAGFYDRTLSRLRQKQEIVAVGIAYAAQEFAAIPAEANDEKLDYVLTDREWITAVTAPQRKAFMLSIPTRLLPIVLLTCSNIFMTFAWYGHLKFKDKPLWLVIILSWMIALAEYCFAVPANRYGSAVYDGAELKAMQEVITLSVFAVFSVLYLGQRLTLNHVVGFGLIALGAFFVFKRPVRRRNGVSASDRFMAGWSSRISECGFFLSAISSAGPAALRSLNSAGAAPGLAARLRRRQWRERRRRFRHHRGDPRRFPRRRSRLRDARQSCLRSARGLELHHPSAASCAPGEFSGRDARPGAALIETAAGARVLVVNLMGRLFMDALDDPFAVGEREIAACPLGEACDAAIVDFHAEATSEKQGFAHFVDGRVSLVVGTHTHVPTADYQILSQGTAYQTDAGMTGDYDSVIGMEKEEPLRRFVTKLPGSRLEPAAGPGDSLRPRRRDGCARPRDKGRACADWRPPFASAAGVLGGCLMPGADPSGADKRLRPTLWLVIGLNLTFFAVEFIVALSIGSVSLFADSVDFLEDTAMSVLVLAAMRLSALARARLGYAFAGVLLLPAIAFLVTLAHKLLRRAAGAGAHALRAHRPRRLHRQHDLRAAAGPGAQCRGQFDPGRISLRPQRHDCQSRDHGRGRGDGALAQHLAGYYCRPRHCCAQCRCREGNLGGGAGRA